MKDALSAAAALRPVVTVVREHKFDAGHRVYGHESVCNRPHGHEYRVAFHCTAPELDSLGRIIDFSVIKERLCAWLDRHWDHRFICWAEDPLADLLETACPSSVFRLPCNPTVENLATYLLSVVAPKEMAGTGVTCTRIVLHETSKCRAEVAL